MADNEAPWRTMGHGWPCFIKISGPQSTEAGCTVRQRDIVLDFIVRPGM